MSLDSPGASSEKKAADLKRLFGADLYAILEDFHGIQHDKTDVFRERVPLPADTEEKLSAARKQGIEAVSVVEDEMGDLGETGPAAVIDLFLSYRAVKGWKKMIDLVRKMPKELAGTLMVREQLAFALNRNGDGEKAEKILRAVLGERGANSETLALLGRVYKDRWTEAMEKGDSSAAGEALERSIEIYLEGFEADRRDTLPGINAVTLMELKEPPDPRREKILPVVLEAVKQRAAKDDADYWDYATLLELSILESDKENAKRYAGQAVTLIREIWEPETTVRNLRLIRKARDKRGDETGWIKEIEDALIAGG
jgi:tetratricopeptide (TPR) repeat protein